MRPLPNNPNKMPTTGLEPVRRLRHWSLKPACLPISARGLASFNVQPSRQLRFRCSLGHARGGTRTPTGFPPQDPDSCASTNSATRAQEDQSGAEGNRTPDLYNAIVALSQLSYGPAPKPSILASKVLVSKHLCSILFGKRPDASNQIKSVSP